MLFLPEFLYNFNIKTAKKNSGKFREVSIFSSLFGGSFPFFPHPEVPVAFCHPGRGRSQPLVMCSGWSFLASVGDPYKPVTVTTGILWRGPHSMGHMYLKIQSKKSKKPPKGSNISHPMIAGERVPVFFVGETCCETWRTFARTYPPLKVGFELMLFFFSRSIFHFHAHGSKGKQNHPPLK